MIQKKNISSHDTFKKDMMGGKKSKKSFKTCRIFFKAKKNEAKQKFAD